MMDAGAPLGDASAVSTGVGGSQLSLLSGLRIGQGYDVHAFAEGRKLILGGVDVPHVRGL